jgi:hypothetical protein
MELAHAEGDVAASGIQWKVRVSVPSKYHPSTGTVTTRQINETQWALIQLVTLSRQVTLKSEVTPAQLTKIQAIAAPGTTIQAGQTYYAKYNNKLSLDTSMPYVNYYEHCDGTLYTNLSDGPSFGGTGYSEVSINPNESFHTFLVLFPEGANSRPVPLYYANWNWGGILELINSDYALIGSQASAFPTDKFPGLQWLPPMDFPAWDQKISRNLLLQIQNN